MTMTKSIKTVGRLCQWVGLLVLN